MFEIKNKKIFSSMISVKKLRSCALILIGILSCICSWDSEVFPKSILVVLCLLPCALAMRDIVVLKKIEKTFVKWYGLFLLLVIISLLYTVNHIDANDVVRRCILCFGLVFSASQLVKDFSDIPKIMYGMILGACLTLVVTLKLESHLIGLGRLGNKTCGAATGFAEILFLALFCAFFLRKKSKIYLLLQIALFGGILLSGSRMPLVLAILCYMIIKLIEVGFSKKLFFTIIGISALVACIGFAVMNNSVLYGVVGKRIDSTMDTVKYGVDKKNDASLEQRSKMKTEAIRLWRQSPIIGYGVNSFCELSPVTNKRASSHCGFTEILCSFGIIGFILFFRPFVYPIKCLFTKKRNIVPVMLLLCLIMEWQSSDFSTCAYILFVFLCLKMCEKNFHKDEYGLPV